MAFILINALIILLFLTQSYSCKNKCTVIVFNVNRQKKQDVIVTGYQLSVYFFVVITERSLYGFFLHAFINQLK